MKLKIPLLQFITLYFVLLHTASSTQYSKEDVDRIAAEYKARILVLTSPEDVGSGHTKIIHNLQLRMEKKLPTSKTEYLRELSLAMSEHVCDPFDVFCNGRVMKNTMDIKVGPQGDAISGFEHLKMNVLPEDFDPIVLKSLEKLFVLISLADLEEDPTDVLNLMKQDFDKLKHSEDVINDEDRIVGLLSYSVGMESTKQWHQIFNDAENPFYRFLISNEEERRQRNLQIFNNPLNPLSNLPIVGNPTSTPADPLIPSTGTGAGIDFGNLLEADVIGASSGIIMGSFDVITGDGVPILSSTLEQASLASAKQVVGDLTPSLPEDCLFPGTILCPEGNAIDNPNNCIFPNSPSCNSTTGTNGFNNDGNPIDPNNPQNCAFPDSPYCNTTSPNLNDSTQGNGCLYPGSVFCDVTHL